MLYETDAKVNEIPPGNAQPGIGGNGGPPLEERAGNWFAVCRTIFDHPIVGIHDRAFTELEAWLWMLSEAAFEPRKVINKGTIIVLDPGQLMHARSYLAKRWKWTEDKVRWFLKRLQTEAMITRHCTQQNTRSRTNQIQIVTISNYAVYQGSTKEEPQTETPPQQPANTQPTPSEHPANTHKVTTKHLKGERETHEEADATEAVKVNCTAIHGPGFKLDFGAIDIVGGLFGVPSERARKIAEACARDWAANGTKPTHPMALVRSHIAKDRNQAQTEDSRATAAARDSPSGRRERIRKHAEEAEAKYRAEQQKQPQWSARQ